MSKSQDGMEREQAIEPLEDSSRVTNLSSIQLVIKDSGYLNHVRGRPVLVPMLEVGQAQQPTFLAWWRTHVNRYGSPPPRWSSWSGPMFHREGLELVSDAEWDSLTAAEQSQLHGWLAADHGAGFCFD